MCTYCLNNRQVKESTSRNISIAKIGSYCELTGNIKEYKDIN